MNEETKDKLYELALEMDNHGFMIPELTPSFPLYRYRGNLENAVKEIEEDYVYLTPTHMLNDPFDSSYPYTYKDSLSSYNTASFYWSGCFFLKRETWYNEIDAVFKETDIGKKEMTMQDFFAFLEKEVQSKGYNFEWEIASKMYFYSTYVRIHSSQKGFVTSFSEIEDSTIMWGYYADSHKGVCLKYEPQLLDDSVAENRSIKRAIRKVWYSKDRFRDDEEKFSPFIKSSEWSHESEWRLFKNSVENNKLKFPCLTAVYLGANFNSKEHFDRIISALSKKERKIDLYKFVPSSKEFALESYRINYDSEKKQS